jgi:hypothetical protein
MSDEMLIDGKSYIPSKLAAQSSGYAQDYIGQLARKNLIDARRIGGLWYISMESLQAYQKKAEEYKPEPPVRAAPTPEPENFVFFDGKEYLSAARAAQITGYSQDYVGQLARSGSILSQQVGNRWYVEKESIQGHKSEKDALLAAVQSQSVGISKPESTLRASSENPVKSSHSGSEPLLNYFSDSGDLLPIAQNISGKSQDAVGVTDSSVSLPQSMSRVAEAEIGSQVPIRRVREYSIRPEPPKQALPKKRQRQGQQTAVTVYRSSLPMLLGATASIIIVLSVGYISILRQNSVYAANITQIPSTQALPADVSAAFNAIGNFLEPYLTHQLDYTNPNPQ